MKRILGIVLAGALTLPLFAGEKASPEERGKRDYSTWLPAAGDMSIGFSLDPLAYFVGNLFNGTEDNNLNNFAGEPLLTPSLVSVMGTYMVTDNLGIRANIGFGLNTSTNNYYVVDQAALEADPLSTALVTDQFKAKSMSGSFALGVEYRVGKKLPVQGVFGGGLVYALGTQKYDFSYGNAITEWNQKPLANSNMPGYTTLPGTRETPGYLQARALSYQSQDLMHSVGAYASIGVEWFVAPKIALGANVNLDIVYTINPARATTYEGWNTLTAEVTTFTNLEAPASHGFHFGTDNIGANLYVSFYF